MEIVITLHGVRRKWDPREATEFIYLCRAKGGLPMFRTGYAGVEFDRRVLAVCYAPREHVPSMVFEEVPPEIMGTLRRAVGDWKILWGLYRKGEPLP